MSAFHPKRTLAGLKPYRSSTRWRLDMLYTPSVRYAARKPPGTKLALKPVHVWGIRVRLQVARRARDLALFDLALDSKLRGCDLVRLRVSDLLSPSGVK